MGAFDTGKTGIRKSFWGREAKRTLKFSSRIHFHSPNWLFGFKKYGFRGEKIFKTTTLGVAFEAVSKAGLAFILCFISSPGWGLQGTPTSQSLSCDRSAVGAETGRGHRGAQPPSHPGCGPPKAPCPGSREPFQAAPGRSGLGPGAGGACGPPTPEGPADVLGE